MQVYLLLPEKVFIIYDDMYSLKGFCNKEDAAIVGQSSGNGKRI
jgi:hypothetical protein